MRRPITLLLMFFLLFTQQVAPSHALGHLAPAALAAAAREERAYDDAEIKKHACAVCLASAQYAAALPVDTFLLHAPEPASHAHMLAQERGAQAAFLLAFHSRAPPIFLS